jgi:hypothetical protein
MSDHASVLQRTHGLLAQILGNVDPPSDSAWVFTFGTVPLVVTVVGDEDPNVVVFTRVIDNVPKSAALLDCLNDINAQLAFGRIYWGSDTQAVYIQEYLVGKTIDREELQTAIQHIGEWGDSLDEALAARFGALAQTHGAPAPWAQHQAAPAGQSSASVFRPA